LIVGKVGSKAKLVIAMAITRLSVCLGGGERVVALVLMDCLLGLVTLKVLRIGLCPLMFTVNVNLIDRLMAFDVPKKRVIHALSSYRGKVWFCHPPQIQGLPAPHW
jgi:hypothetical protein